MRNSKAMLLTSVYACMATFLVVAFYTSLRLAIADISDSDS